MLGRRRIHTTAPIRSSLSHAALAVEEHVVWGGIDVLRRIVDAVKWPFERAIWAIERGLVWPLEERTGDWSGPFRAAGVAAVALLAVGAGVLGLLWASGSGGSKAPTVQQVSSPPATPPVAVPTAKEQAVNAAPVLHGAAPDFTPEAGDGAAATKPAEAGGGSAASAAGSASSTAPAPAGSPTTAAQTAAAQAAGPAATKVARQFSTAFVLYETGRNDAAVRTAFAATATPQLAQKLLRRPPRLPADVKVPKAKVLNLVPGPKHGDTYTLSVSLLRVGVTSELRIDMQRDKKTGRWQVVDVRG